MPEDYRLNTNYKYSISLLYTMDNDYIEINYDKISSLTIDYDYMKKNMPIILARLVLNKKIIDHMITNKNKVIVLSISKYSESNILQINKNFIRSEFFYFLDNNMNHFDDLDFGDSNKDREDITKIISIGLIKKDSVLNNKVLINTVYDNTSLLDIICSKFDNILIEPFNNRIVNNFIVPPIESLSKFISYINNEYTLYDTQYRLFYDFNKTYLLSSSGKSVQCRDEKYCSVIININNVMSNESRAQGMIEDSDSGSYIINVDASNINVSIDNATTLSYNEIIGIDSQGNSKTINLDSDIEGNRHKVIRIHNDNLDKLNNIRNNINMNKTTINIIKDRLDSEVITMNKEYYLNNYNKLSDKNGRYLLVAKKEIYMKETNYFHMVTILTLKKIPSA